MTEESNTRQPKVVQLEINANGTADLLTDPTLLFKPSPKPDDTTEISVTFPVSREIAEDYKNNRLKISKAVLTLERTEYDEAPTEQLSAARAVNGNGNVSLICMEYPDGAGGMKRRCFQVG